MEIIMLLALACILGAPFVAIWIHFKKRLGDLELRVAHLTDRLNQQEHYQYRIAVPPDPDPEPDVRPQQQTPVSEVPHLDSEPIATPVELPPLIPILPEAVPAFTASTPHAPTKDWEALLGGNWLNKVGVFLLVVGIALALGYSFTRVGPLGRASMGVAASLAMLASGAILEPRERYRTFARGLLGGGWAALYVTVFAMHAVEAARVITNPVLGFLLLLAVAAGMVIHSLRYRSETITGLAYVAAFGTLAGCGKMALGESCRPSQRFFETF